MLADKGWNTGNNLGSLLTEVLEDKRYNQPICVSVGLDYQLYILPDSDKFYN